MNSSDLKDIAVHLEYLIDVHGMEMGEYAASGNEVEQTRTYHCHGCRAEYVSRWPSWELKFAHEPGCRYTKILNFIRETLQSQALHPLRSTTMAIKQSEVLQDMSKAESDAQKIHQLEVRVKHLEAEVLEYVRAEAVLIAARKVNEDTVKQAHEIVRVCS